MAEDQNWVEDTVPFMIFYIIILGLSVVSILLIGNHYVLKNIQIPNHLESTIIMQRFYNSPDCFAYQDQTGRMYQKSIDWNKFNSGKLTDRCISSNNLKQAFKLELMGPENTGKIVLTPNWIEVPSFRSLQRDVSVYYNDKDVNRRLSISIKDE